MSGAQELAFDSEAGCFFCCANDLELLKTCAATMRSCCENQEQFAALVREALDYSFRITPPLASDMRL